MSALDKIDIAIADRLQQDGRLSNAKLAEQLGLSEASCWRRQKRLEEAGVIEGAELPQHNG
jgi:DNA-binding Lrp family transcriptional regulator